MKNSTKIIGTILFILIIVNIILYSALQDITQSAIEKPSSTDSDNSNDNLQEGIVSKYLNRQREIIYYVNALPSGVNEKVLESLSKSLDFWEDYEDVVFTETSSERDSDLQIYWVKEFGGEHIGYSYVNLIEIGLGSSYCVESWQQFNEDTLTLLSSHEIGHFLGYEHSEDETDLMYYQLETQLEKEIDKSDILPEEYVQFYPFCSNKETTRYSIEITSDSPLDIYVVESIENYNLFIEGEEFYYYEECDQENTQSYAKECVVSQGAGIIISDSSFFGSSVEYDIMVREL